MLSAHLKCESCTCKLEQLALVRMCIFASAEFYHTCSLTNILLPTVSKQKKSVNNAIDVTEYSTIANP